MSKLTSEKIAELLSKEEIRVNASSVSFDEIDNFGNQESLRQMLVDIGKYNKMLKERITLVNDALTAAIPFTRENLYLFCAVSGTGKSTTAANISYPLWKQGKKVLVLSNEESQQDVLFRVACLDLKLNFNDYKKGRMSPEDQKRAVSLFPEIASYVKVIDVTYKNGLTTTIEGIKSALEAVKTKDYSCVLIDYFQLIKYSATDRSKTAYENLNDLRVWLGQYIKGSNAPVVMFAQLYTMSKKGGTKDLEARLKDCSAIVEPSTVIVEVVPNFEEQVTDFLIVKDRFGLAGHKVTCGFESGRYIKMSEAELAERKVNMLSKKAEDRLAELQGVVHADNVE